jgi:hypothetical protein
MSDYYSILKQFNILNEKVKNLEIEKKNLINNNIKYIHPDIIFNKLECNSDNYNFLKINIIFHDNYIFNFLDKIEMNVDIKPLIDDLLKLYRFCYENPFSIKNINISCFDKNNNIIYSFEYDFLNVYLDLNYIENITYIFYNLQNKLINNIENIKNIENII